MIMNNNNNNNNHNNNTFLKDNEKLYNFLNQNKETLKFLRICWVDVGNKIRCKSLSVEWILKHKPEAIHVTVTDTCMSFMAFQDSIVKDALPDGNVIFGEVYLIPDVSTITILPYNKSHAQVFGSFYKVNKTTGDLEPWKLCPRECLKKAIKELLITASLSLKGSFEEEFYLIKKNDKLSSTTNEDQELEKMLNESSQVDRNTFASFHSLDSHSAILNEILDNLSKQSIPVEQMLSESGPGQFEITVDYSDILTACDRHIIFRQTVHSVASLNGYIATFIPKLYDYQAGNGCHAHLSLWNANDDTNITPDPNSECGVGLLTQNFIGGILEHAHSLTALFNATSNSYERLKPFCWSGCSIAWGLDNKEAFVRVPSSPFSRSCTNFEVKTIDHSSNPYLAISAIIYSGLDGINKHTTPPKPTSLNPSTLSDKECKEMKISFIPSTITDAINYLKSNDYLCNSLGKEISNAYIQVKLSEESILSKLSNNHKKLKLLELY
ncbi:hypothetical protein DICPUDRAFT_50065 [Dictyostelium purpureum]|uniref:Uncharacterized protein n=1 Tax=Dictyostelium purpureum TaxID=5786 RepID=F0ZWN4_DICPU|nr:uncharacterized protein DICPUDRAFT_50065 [Dictyostelium purpureum]EGC31662.1 hypothetical protein DICPUDRAFT_50065 [Dictyostelium purpureum]|eukprot:XP_003291828.1 hypothetical protein DICPUDRAFT_50065 [Dictyostelium purpureum]